MKVNFDRSKWHLIPEKMEEKTISEKSLFLILFIKKMGPLEINFYSASKLNRHTTLAMEFDVNYAN